MSNLDSVELTSKVKVRRAAEDVAVSDGAETQSESEAQPAIPVKHFFTSDIYQDDNFLFRMPEIVPNSKLAGSIKCQLLYL